MRHPEFPIISFLMVPLLLSSLPSHLRTRSVAMISLIAWMTILNIIRGVNAIIWADNVIVRLEIWCDITTKITIGFTHAVPLSALCICRHLEAISSNRNAMYTEYDKRRRILLETILCFGIPMILMALHYIVQGHRFDVIEDIGCNPATYTSIAALFIVWLPPLVFSSISMVYALAAFHHFLKRRIEFTAILQSSNSAISTARYMRLIAFSVFEILWDSGNNIYAIYFNLAPEGFRPWISWGNVHENFSRVDQFPHFLIPTELMNQTIYLWWIIPISSISFFLFFGISEEAMSDYRKAFSLIGCCMPRRRDAVKVQSELPSYSASLPNSMKAAFPRSSIYDGLPIKVLSMDFEPLKSASVITGGHPYDNKMDFDSGHGASSPASISSFTSLSPTTPSSCISSAVSSHGGEQLSVVPPSLEPAEASLDDLPCVPRIPEVQDGLNNKLNADVPSQ